MLTLFLLSCNSDQEQVVKNESNTEASSEIFLSSTTFLYTGNSIYSKYFDGNVDNEIAYYTTKENANDRNFHFINQSVAVQRSGIGATTVTANGIDLRTLNSNDNIGRTSVEDISDILFGKEVIYKFGDAAITRSSSTAEDGNSVNMYIPHIIEIVYPEAIPYALDPLCPYDDLLIEWNRDEKNINGVVVVVEWDGHMVGQEYKWEGVRTIDVVEDTGEAILNPKMFEGMPDFALINITLLRGNIDIVEIENSPVKLYATSNSSIQVVLAKEPI